jgi:putative methyltransferase
MNFYKKIGDILKDQSLTHSSFKNAIYSKLKNFNDEKHFTKIYKIVIEILKNKELLTNIILNFFPDENIKDKEQFMVMIYEKFLSDTKKKIGGKLMRLLKDKEIEIKKWLELNKPELQSFEDEFKDNNMYFRLVNVNENLQRSESFIQMKKDDIIPELYWVDKKLQNNLLKEIFRLRDNNEIIIQSKSSSLPAYLLKLATDKYLQNKKYDLLDCCSAPGNKTLQLGQYFTKGDRKNNIYAFEINEKRFNILSSNIQRYKEISQNILLVNDDFLKSDPKDIKFKNVKIILADPSCSGSGTLNNAFLDKESSLTFSKCCLEIAGSKLEKSQISRLKKLFNFQIKILLHCMDFPNVTLISYSTCSIFMTENEFVVSKVLKQREDFELLNIFELNPKLEEFHKGVTKETEYTLRICRKCHKIDGFYVSIFKRK